MVTAFIFAIAAMAYQEETFLQEEEPAP